MSSFEVISKLTDLFYSPYNVDSEVRRSRNPIKISVTDSRRGLFQSKLTSPPTAFQLTFRWDILSYVWLWWTALPEMSPHSNFNKLLVELSFAMCSVAITTISTARRRCEERYITNFNLFAVFGVTLCEMSDLEGAYIFLGWKATVGELVRDWSRGGWQFWELNFNIPLH